MPSTAPLPPTPSTTTTTGSLSKVYNGLVGAIDKHVSPRFRPLWLHPAGPKTVFFWAPLFKWGLVIAGIGDWSRTPDRLSPGQCGMIALSAIIYSRWSLVIKPKNYSLFAVNAFVAFTQSIQVARIILYELEQSKRQNK